LQVSDPSPGFQGHDIQRQISRKWYNIWLYLQRQTDTKSYYDVSNGGIFNEFG